MAAPELKPFVPPPVERATTRFPLRWIAVGKENATGDPWLDGGNHLRRMVVALPAAET